eukprot:TRINITY_DN92_c0_g1_i1.p1 TRINITY_DN92_c0_g1~~TRINITY_DN92_c0_g1_i1.p1  ORF type:complete len:614 (-),score=54.77 TRINITY_DN92_c0_g1_i1:747-2588(-)
MHLGLVLVAAAMLLVVVGAQTTYTPAVAFDNSKYSSYRTGRYSCGMAVTVDHTVRVIALGVGTKNTLVSNVNSLVTNVNLTLRNGDCTGAVLAAVNIPGSPSTPVTSPTGGGYIWKALGAPVCIAAGSKATLYAHAYWQTPDPIIGVSDSLASPPILSTYTGLTLVGKPLLSSSTPDKCPTGVANTWCGNLALADCPTTADDIFVFNVGGPYVAVAPGVRQNDITSGTVTLAVTAQPTSGTVVLQNDGSFTYTISGPSIQPDQFQYTITDSTLGVGCPATVRIQVNHPPVASNDNVPQVAVAVGATSATFAFNVLSNDADPDNDALSAVLVTQSAHGLVTLQPSGTFTFAWDQTFTGTDSFTYKASDGSLQSSNAVVSFSVNRPPVAANDAAPNVNAAVGATSVAFTFNVLTNDIDNDVGDQAKLTAALVANAQHGTVSLQSSGTFSFTWDQTFTGTDSFTYAASDGVTTSNTATVTFSVNRPSCVARHSSYSAVARRDFGFVHVQHPLKRPRPRLWRPAHRGDSHPTRARPCRPSRHRRGLHVLLMGQRVQWLGHFQLRRGGLSRCAEQLCHGHVQHELGTGGCRRRDPNGHRDKHCDVGVVLSVQRPVQRP